MAEFDFDWEAKRPAKALTFEDSHTQDGRAHASRPHRELVGALRAYVDDFLQTSPYVGSAENVVRKELELKWQGEKGDEARFYRNIADAFDAIAYDRYEAGSYEERWAAGWLSQRFGEYRTPHIIPSKSEGKVLDALAEAVEVPHQKELREITIPDRLQGQEKLLQWWDSDEYVARLNTAHAKKV